MDRKALHSHFLSLGWGRDPHSNHVFDFTCQAIESAKGGAILDAGSGFQACKPFFDKSSIYVSQEHPASGAELKNIKEYDILCDAKDIPLADNCVRVVFSNVSLEHMRYPEPFFRESHRVLEPGGKLFIQVSFVYMEHEQPYDFQRPTSFGLKRWFDDAGFTSCEIRPSSSSIYTSMWAAQAAVEEELRRGFKRKYDRLKARMTFAISYWLFAYLKKHCDRGPWAEVQFPIGWTAIGRKAGSPIMNQIPETSTRQFLEKNKSINSHFEGSTLLLGAATVPTT